MLVEKRLSTKEKLILEAALKIMFKENFEAASIDAVQKLAVINSNQIKNIFVTDDYLRMAAMEYGAIKWVNYIKLDMQSEAEKPEKIKKLIRHFAAGSENYSQSLSLYIDVWKRIRDSEDNENSFVKQKLLNIYEYYVEAFIDIFENEISIGSNNDFDIRQLAWIMVVISDGLHIQSLIQPKPLDFDTVGDVLNKMVRCVSGESEDIG